VYDSSAAGWTAAAGSGTLFKLEVPGRVGPAMLLAQDEAERDLLKELYINQAPMDLTPAAQAAICRVLKQAIVPNIQFDSDLTSLKRQAAVATVKPVVEDVVKGEVLVDPSAPVTLDQRERLTAYNLELSKRSSTDLTSMTGLTQRFLFVALLLAAAVIFIKSGLGQLEHSPKLFALTGVLLLLNLAVLRIVLSLGDTSLLESRPTVQAVLPWVAPTVLAPMLVAVLIGAAPAVLTALLISILFSMMTGDTLEVFLVNFLAALVTIHLCREVRMRKRLVRAGLVGGLAAAACAAYLGYVNELGTSTNTVFDQMLVAVLTGLLTAVVAIGLLPLFEHLFKITTDITLLELTDFNHPLLRKLQLAAPGSYHHSLMVANLAERAAAEIGANALMCRTCALYHDIGKMVKPEYFTENQRDGFNPHAEVNPSMSALIIKSHVKEGLDLAQQYKLPQVVQDVIAQHHGTTLIKYFYRKASEQQQLLAPAPFPRRGHASRAPFAPADAPAPTPEPAERGESNLDESFYRYDGPKPRFRESVIIALADAVEAASRSLRKVTPLAVEELIESLINDRLEDHQLDDSPITLQELKKIKQSFNFTLLNMLHSRVQYPGEQGVAPAPAAKTAGTPPARATA
jgi:putative nucleotidyltransferase with HDIG domain